ncbi:MAG TPA: ATPase, T2SS/T4P/T4SS family [Woeseiaceae bacterium]|nr:ATPase, T2SS/T4P/T4SS family [Woeseiaceae bacterium]
MAVLVHVYDLRSSRIGEYRLEESLLVGRDSACDIVLPSPYISPKHAELKLLGDEVSVFAIGFNGVFVNDVDVPAGSQRVVHTGDITSVPGYVLHLTGLAESELLSELALEQQLSKVKADIHAELLASSEMRNVDSDSADQKTADKLRRKLNELLDRDDQLMSDQLIEHIVAREIRQQVVSTVVRGGADESKTQKLQWSLSTDQVALSKFVETVLYELGIGKNPGKSKIADVLERFDPIFQRNKRVLGKNQMKFIAWESIRADIESLVFGLGPLEDLLNLPDITEIMVVGKDQIFIEKGGGLERTGRSFPSEDDLNVAVSRMVRPIGRTVNRSEPIVDARLEDGSRVHIVIPPVAIRGTSVTIRRFREEPFTIDDLVRFGTFGPRAVTFLRGCILARKNIVISGGTGSGKTTLLNVLGAQIPFDQRLVVIEDSAELQLPQPNLVNLEAKKANLEGEGEISIKDLVRASLRMRPDRIIVGECRGGEALDMLQAMNTGHDGSMTTGHANSPQEMMQRLQVMVMEAGGSMPVAAIRQQIAAAVDVIVQIQRQRDRVRRVTHISEVVGYDFDSEEVIMEDVFTLATPANAPPDLRFTGYLPTFIEQLLRHGDIELKELF